MNRDDFFTMALSFADTEQSPHFERTGFRVKGKRMFATYLPSAHSANVFLTPPEQRFFCHADAKNIYPVPNKWGEKGATTFELKNVNEALLHEALNTAYQAVAVAKPHRPQKKR